MTSERPAEHHVVVTTTQNFNALVNILPFKVREHTDILTMTFTIMFAVSRHIKHNRNIHLNDYCIVSGTNFTNCVSLTVTVKKAMKICIKFLNYARENVKLEEIE